MYVRDRLATMHADMWAHNNFVLQGYQILDSYIIYMIHAIYMINVQLMNYWKKWWSYIYVVACKHDIHVSIRYQY